ncbi:DUF2637 domain-containing protein [Streptomyces axinellae]
MVIAAIGFAGSFSAVRELAEKKGFGTFAPFFPIGVDAGIVVLLALDLLLTWIRIPFPLLRQTAWLLTAATIAFNGAAAWPDPLGVGMHAVIPVLFVVTVEAARHAIGRVADITADKHMEGVRLSRWLLAFPSTFRLWRRMKLWELRSYDEVIRMEQDRLVYETRLRARYGRAWRRKAPVEAMMPLRLARYGVPLTETAPGSLITRAGAPPAPHTHPTASALVPASDAPATDPPAPASAPAPTGIDAEAPPRQALDSAEPAAETADSAALTTADVGEQSPPHTPSEPPRTSPGPARSASGPGPDGTPLPQDERAPAPAPIATRQAQPSPPSATGPGPGPGPTVESAPPVPDFPVPVAPGRYRTLATPAPSHASGSGSGNGNGNGNGNGEGHVTAPGYTAESLFAEPADFVNPVDRTDPVQPQPAPAPAPTPAPTPPPPAHEAVGVDERDEGPYGGGELLGIPDGVPREEVYFESYRQFVASHGAFPTARQLSRTLHDSLGVMTSDGGLLSEGYLRTYMREFRERYNTEMGLAG